MSQQLFDFAVTTIFAREFLEGSIIVGEYRTIIIRGSDDCLAQGVQRQDALREVTLSALFATAFALLVVAAIAIPLSILSHGFDTTTSNIIEGVSKIVAAISLLQLSLKLPKFLEVYGSTKQKNKRKNQTPTTTDGEEEHGMTLRHIRFNVAWNIWREVAECGVFLIPFFLSGEGLISIPLSAVVGSIIGLGVGVGIYYANKRFQNKVGLAIFSVLLIVFLSAGLFADGCHKLEGEINSTATVWEIPGDFWDAHRLPMTILKPFGYNDSRTVLEIVCYWSWIGLSALLHYRKYRISPKISQSQEDTAELKENRSVVTHQCTLAVTVEEDSQEVEVIREEIVSSSDDDKDIENNAMDPNNM